MLTQDHLYPQVEACCANLAALCPRVSDNESYELVISPWFELVSVHMRRRRTCL